MSSAFGVPTTARLASFRHAHPRPRVIVVVRVVLGAAAANAHAALLRPCAPRPATPTPYSHSPSPPRGSPPGRTQTKTRTKPVVRTHHNDQAEGSRLAREGEWQGARESGSPCPPPVMSAMERDSGRYSRAPAVGQSQSYSPAGVDRGPRNAGYHEEDEDEATWVDGDEEGDGEEERFTYMTPTRLE
ncbi:hypothetical protein B0H11DRAFT_2258149 [Mycena galericulata]|nr:hypothetical protein B0H11DRAFT_2258149 [Mycena galericulata]